MKASQGRDRVNSRGVRASSYIGRIGALAAALGIGAVVVTGQGLGIATADDAPSQTSSSSAAGDTSVKSTAVDSDESAPTTSGSAKSEHASDTATTPESTDAGDGDDSPPGSPGTDTADENATDGDEPSTTAPPTVDPTAVEAPVTSAEPDPAPSVEPEASSGNGNQAAEPADRDETVDSSNSSATPPLAVSTRVEQALSARTVANTPLATTPTSPDFSTKNSPAPEARTALAPSTPPAGAPVLQEGPFGAILAVPAFAIRIATTITATLLAPLLGTPSPIPIPSGTPVLLAVLGWVDREIKRTFFNHTPVADVVAASTDEDTPIVIDVTRGGAIDGDPGDVLTVTSYTQPAHGTVSLTDGKLVYTPTANYKGADSFSYTVSDANSAWHVHGLLGLLFSGRHTDTATIALTVTPVNDLPVAVDDTALVRQGASQQIINVLANDSDIDAGQTLTVVGVGAANHGTVSIVGATVSYTPDADFAGSDAFTYTVGDGAGGTATATVAVTVVLQNRTVEFDGAAVGPLIVTPDGTRAIQRVYLPDSGAFGDTQIVVIDTTTGAIIGSPTVSYPSSQPVLLSADGHTAYILRDISNTISPQMTILDTTTGTILANTGIPRGGNITGFTLTPDGTRILINKSAGDDGTDPVKAKLTIINATTGTVLATPEFDGAAVGPLIVTPDGTRAIQRVYLPDSGAFGDTQIVVID
ncbi:Ig-like domain-containing protein, partial [Mycobacterium sp. 236(2023)]|uniref:Ig-like domain-containing protein n=1 Tax=Mycobacterium sp. 236(2023) TaxID=3038163 RepID=UPI002414D13B